MVEAYGEKQDPVILERTHFQPSWRKGQVISQSQIRYNLNNYKYIIYIDATLQSMIKESSMQILTAILMDTEETPLMILQTNYF